MWAAPVHSLVGGAVTAAGVALDGSYLVTGAADGTLMVLSVDVAHFPGLATGGEQQPESLPTAHEEKGWVAAPELGTDVVETLEEERTRKEAEALQAASELKKRSLREQMAALRAKHAALVRANAEAASQHVRLRGGEGAARVPGGEGGGAGAARPAAHAHGDGHADDEGDDVKRRMRSPLEP